MQGMLNNVKETAETTGGVPVEEDENIYPSDFSFMVSGKIISRFKVGDYVVIEGTEAHEFKSQVDIFPFPSWMELRIRYNSDGMFVIFYPKGMLVWKWICQDIHRYKMQFKCEILHGDKLGYKIWRSK